MIHRIHLTRHGTRHMRDIQAAHATIAAATDGTSQRTLWALPRHDLLLVRADHCHLPGHLTREHHAGPHQPALATGQPITLTAIINPVTDHDGSRRVIHLDDTRTWLQRRLAPVDLHQVEMEDLGRRGGWRHGRRIVIAWRAITATATVHDPDGLRTVLDTGLGRAKAYGCGLVLAGGGAA